MGVSTYKFEGMQFSPWHFLSEAFPEKWKWKSLSHVWVFATPWTIQTMEFSRSDTEVGRPSLLQGIEPRDWTQAFWIAGGSFTSWATREAQGLPWEPIYIYDLYAIILLMPLLGFIFLHGTFYFQTYCIYYMFNSLVWSVHTKINIQGFGAVCSFRYL